MSELEMTEHVRHAAKLIEEAESQIRPGNTLTSIQEPLITAQLELMKAFLLATQAAIEAVVMPQRIMFMEDL